MNRDKQRVAREATDTADATFARRHRVLSEHNDRIHREFLTMDEAQKQRVIIEDFANALTYNENNRSIDITLLRPSKDGNGKWPKGERFTAEVIDGRGLPLDQLPIWLQLEFNCSPGHAGAYYSFNKVKPSKAIQSKYGQYGIEAIRGVFIDIDPDGYVSNCNAWALKNENATDDEFRAAILDIWDQERERCKGVAIRLWSSDSPPSIIVDSGGGFQCLWLLETALPISDENFRWFVQTQANLIAAVPEADRQVRDLPRILRMPGTLNKKRGRPWGESSIRAGHAKHASDGKRRRYSPDELSKAWPTASIDRAQIAGSVHVSNAAEAATIADLQSAPETPDLLERLETAGGTLGDLWRLGPDSKRWLGDDQSGSGCRFNLAMRMAESGCGIGDFWQALLAWDWSVGRNALDERQAARAWIAALAILAARRGEAGSSFEAVQEEADCLDRVTDRNFSDTELEDIFSLGDAPAVHATKMVVKKNSTRIKGQRMKKQLHANMSEYDLLNGVYEAVAPIDMESDINLVRRGGLLFRAPTRGEQRLEPLSQEGVGLIVSARVEVIRVDDKGNESVLPRSKWPEAARVALKASEHVSLSPILECKGVTSGPIVRLDGTLGLARGLDPATQLWSHTDWPELKCVPETPTRDDAIAAVAILSELLADVPFGGSPEDAACYRAAAMAGLLTAVLRPALPLAPGIAISANAPGSGKTYLAQSIAMLGGDPEPSVQSPAKDESEIKKTIDSLISVGTRHAIMDNINGQFNSDALAAVLTSRRYEYRPLGSTRIDVAEPNMLVQLTGNGLTINQDLIRRFLTIQLDRARAGQRDGDHGAHGLLREDRGRFVAACATIVRWGHLARKAGILRGPARGLLPSFEQWDRTICWPLIGLGLADPVLTQTISAAADPVADERAELLRNWHGALGDQLATAAHLARIVMGSLATHDEESGEALTPLTLAPGVAVEALGDGLRALCAPGVVNARTLGRRLQGLRDVDAGDWRLIIVPDPRKRGATRYGLVPAGGAKMVA